MNLNLNNLNLNLNLNTQLINLYHKYNVNIYPNYYYYYYYGSKMMFKLHSNDYLQMLVSKCPFPDYIQNMFKNLSQIMFKLYSKLHRNDQMIQIVSKIISIV